MTREEAEALAAKREAHKSRSLWQREWRAVDDPEKGWTVALVETVAAAQTRIMEKARAAFWNSDLEAVLNASDELLDTRLRAIFGEATHDRG